MINVAEVIIDPDFCQTFTVYRKTGSWVDGRFVTVETSFETTGVIVPISSALQLDQTADRMTGSISIYTIVPIYTTKREGGDGTSDEVVWHGDRYRINNTNEYNDYGFWSAVGTLLSRSV